MNNITLMGRFTRDPELRYSPSAEPLAILKNSLAVSRQTKGEVDFINVTAFGKTAETINKFFTKGDPIAVIGHLHQGSYENRDGKKVTTFEVIIDRFHFTPEKKRDSTPAAVKPGVAYTPYDGVDDLPF